MGRLVRLVVVAMVFAGMPAVPALAAPDPLVPAEAEAALVPVIVTLDDTAGLPEAAATRAAEALGGRVGHVYRHALTGFSMEVPARLIPVLQRRPGVVSVERDVEVRINAQPVPTGVDRVEGDLNPGAGDFSGVDIAVLDTGVYFSETPQGAFSHEDLNLTFVSDCTGAIFYPLFGGCQGGGNDDNGHGTHVAGILGACDNEIGSLGTAPCATIWSIKIIGADGTGSGGALLAGVDLVAANADQIEVANMSFTLSGPLEAFDTAVNNAIAAGVVMVAAAGNDGVDAGSFPPANIPDVITVSAISDYDGKPGGLSAPTCWPDPDDTFAGYSNDGASVDIAAPGTCIFSTHLNDGYATFTGTSMASPAVAGAAARYIAEQQLDPQNADDVAAVRNALVNGGIPQTDDECGFTGDTDGIAEPLLFLNGSAFGGNLSCGDGGPPVNQPPVAAFAASCNQLTCDFDASGSSDDGSIVSYDWEFGDGAAGAGVTTSHTYAAAGSYSVTLTVTDDEGLTDSATQQVNPTEPPVNQPPVAAFAASCNQLTCDFDASGSSDDGSIVSYDWQFGDGAAGAGVTVSHTYAAAGSYSVTLTVTDDEGLTDSTTQQVNPTEPGDVIMTVGVPGFTVSGRDATVQFFVIDEFFNAVPGAAVVGEWEYRDRRGRLRVREVTATSDALGFVSITTRFPRGATVLEFCVTDVTKPGYIYEPGFFSCGGPL